jgi:hypothetical protein
MDHRRSHVAFDPGRQGRDLGLERRQRGVRRRGRQDPKRADEQADGGQDASCKGE